MSFTTSPTEQTTAITDLIMAIQALMTFIYLSRVATDRPLWTRLWKWVFGLLALASLLGAIAHGIVMSGAMITAIWAPIYLALGLLIALLAVAAISHKWGDAIAGRYLPIGIGIAGIFFLTTQLWSGAFVLFLVYEAVTMVIVFAIYMSCVSDSIVRRGTKTLAAGILVTILAALVDLRQSLRVELIWTFDNHGVFHLVQMVSLALLSWGVYRSHQPLSDSSPIEDEPNLGERLGMAVAMSEAEVEDSPAFEVP